MGKVHDHASHFGSCTLYSYLLLYLAANVLNLRHDIYDLHLARSLPWYRRSLSTCTLTLPRSREYFLPVNLKGPSTQLLWADLFPLPRFSRIRKDVLEGCHLTTSYFVTAFTESLYLFHFFGSRRSAAALLHLRMATVIASSPFKATVGSFLVVPLPIHILISI